MADREKVIKGLESLRDICNAKHDMAIGEGKVAWAGYANTADDALALLKAQEEERKRMITWLAKFCRHIDNRDRWMTEQENLEFFKGKMKQQFGWEFHDPPKEEIRYSGFREITDEDMLEEVSDDG